MKEVVKEREGRDAEDRKCKEVEKKGKEKKGTTEEGIKKINNDSGDRIIHDAIQKATHRSTEISRELGNE